MSQTTRVSSSEPDANRADDGEKQQTRIALCDSCCNLTTCSPVQFVETKLQQSLVVQSLTNVTIPKDDVAIGGCRGHDGAEWRKSNTVHSVLVTLQRRQLVRREQITIFRFNVPQQNLTIVRATGQLVFTTKIKPIHVGFVSIQNLIECIHRCE